jgi:hypothetical protein
MHNQVKMLKAVFEVYKTPSMPECQQLADFVGLQKRVVQVWFQNARAKEKKARLHLQELTGGQEGASEALPTTEECTFCCRRYANKNKVQEHIFERGHLENVRAAIEAGRYEPETPGAGLQSLIAGRSRGSAAPATPLINFEQNLERLAERDREREKESAKRPVDDQPSSKGAASSTFLNELSLRHQQQQQYTAQLQQQQQPSHSYRTEQQGFSFSLQQQHHQQQRKFYEQSLAYGREEQGGGYNSSSGGGSGGGPMLMGEYGSLPPYCLGQQPDYGQHALQPPHHHYPGPAAVPYPQNGYAGGGMFPNGYGGGFAFQPGVPN